MPQQDPWSDFMPGASTAAPQPRPIMGPPPVAKQPDPVAIQNADRGDRAEGRQAAQSTWTTLPASEATKRGLPPGGTYQVNGLNEVKTILAPPKAGPDPVSTAKSILTSAGVDLLSEDDRVADLIRGSTSGGVQKFGADLYGDLTGDSTDGMENIATLKALASDLTLQMTGGSLGNQISNADRDFIMDRMGNIGDARAPADQRLAAWKEVRGRLARTLGVDLPLEVRVTDDSDDEGLTGVTTDDGTNNIATGLNTPPSGGNGGGMDILSKGIPNTLAGLAQGAASATYDLGASVGDALEYGLRQGGGALLDLGGANNAADWWRGDFRASPTASDTIEQMFPTPEGYGASRFASQLVGGAMVPFGPKATPRVRLPTNMDAIANPARDVIQAGKDAGVRVMTSDVREPTTFLGKTAQAMGERIPIAGTGAARAAQQEERVKAVKDIAKDFGADIAGNYLDDIASDLATTRGTQISNLTKVKNAVIDGVQGVFQAPRTVQAIDQQVARLKGINEGAFAPVIKQLEAFKANIVSGKTLREVEGNRKLLGDMFEDPNLSAIRGDGQKAVNAVYAPLREDMGAFIKQTAGDKAYQKWAASNERLSVLAGELDSTAFKSVLRNSETTPEVVGRLLTNKSPSEVRRLYSNLSPAGQAKTRAGILAMAIEKAGGIDNISPDKFANAIAQNSKAAGVAFEGADLDRLRGLERLLQYTKRAGAASAAPPTGVQNAPLIGAGVGYAGGLPAIASMGGVGLLARLYESPATRNLLIKLDKTPKGSKAEGVWLERILKAATSQAGQVREAANSNAISAAAAGNPEQQ